MNEVNSADKSRRLPPDNNLAWAIVATLLCCWPFGIPAIIYALKVEPYWRDGHYEAAQKAANEAKKWSIISAISAGVVWLGYILVMAVVAIIGMSL
jgi:hypothetical protein